jgi:hypothetical protein
MNEKTRIYKINPNKKQFSKSTKKYCAPEDK